MTVPVLLTTTQIQIDTALNNASGNAIANSAVTNALANKAGVTTITTDSSASVTITALADNTVYQLTNSALTALSITGLATGFVQAAITFTSGSTQTAFSVPADGGTASTTWRCIGEDCSNGSFVPVADKRYNLAIYQEADRVAVYVMNATA